MNKEYVASITNDEEQPELLTLTIKGTQRTSIIPSYSRIVNYSKIDTSEEIRKYKSVDDLQRDINRERTLRSRERLMSFGLLGVSCISAIGSSFNGNISLAIIPLSAGVGLWLVLSEHASDGLRKYNAALKAFRETRFNVNQPATPEGDQNLVQI